jgi:hypothetical protein
MGISRQLSWVRISFCISVRAYTSHFGPARDAARAFPIRRGSFFEVLGTKMASRPSVFTVDCRGLLPTTPWPRRRAFVRNAERLLRTGHPGFARNAVRGQPPVSQ